MKKIRIPVHESEYNVYYDYCLKYYQVHDTVRKQSIHAFLDLYVKGIIPVENKDIRRARNLLAAKCSELKKEHHAPGKENDSTILFQSRVCSDITLFIEDLEQMYHLIQRQGIAADYLLLLGTFSKIIHDEMSSTLSVQYNLKEETIESLARPLAVMIRQRQGVILTWSDVLHELIAIAIRFNRQSSELKFDLDILKLIAPAVVAFFDKGIPAQEILAVLPSYYEKHKLDEFETFLNQVPGQKNDQYADINWEPIKKPLEVVAGAVGSQRSLWSQGFSTIYDQNSLAPPSTMPSPERGHSPVASPRPLFLAPMHADDLKAFDIVVSPDETEQTVSPVRVRSPSTPSPGKSGMKPVIPVIAGVAVIVIVIVAVIFFSGYLNHPVTTNTSNSTGVPTVKSTTAKPTTTVPTTKPTTTIPSPTPLPTPKSYSSAEIGNHLLEIGFGPNNDVIKKATKTPLVVSLGGVYNQPDVALVNNFISQFNNYSSTTKISENINFNSEGDIALELQPAGVFTQINTTIGYNDPQTGTRYFVLSREATFVNSDVTVKTYVNSDLKGEERKRWILRSILYNLGFFGETAKYPDSIFYAGTTNSSQLSVIDLKALQLMYGNKITNGMTKSKVSGVM